MKSIFISSTFKDMQSERDIIQTDVLPELRDYARKYGESVHFVDLRWGVDTSDLESEEGARKVLSVCLDQIEACKPSKPYMIILIGERYGWIPRPELLNSAVKNAKSDIYTLDDMEKSVTALEIEYGALSEDSDPERCLFYFREPLPEDQMTPGQREDYATEDCAHQVRLKGLKQKIQDKIGDKVNYYHAQLDGDKGRVIGLEALAQKITQDIKNLMAEEMGKAAERSWYGKEMQDITLFIEEKNRKFSARKPLVDTISKIIEVPATQLYILQGKVGAGKSTIISHLATQLKAKGHEIIPFISGLSEKSTSAMDILKHGVYHMEELLKKTEHFENQTTIEKRNTPSLHSPEENSLDFSDRTAQQSKVPDISDWKEAFQTLLYEYRRIHKTPITILIDALDQLSADETQKRFLWLPAGLPEGVTIVLSCLDSIEIPASLLSKEATQHQILGNLTELEKESIIQSNFKDAGKEISTSLIQAIKNKSGSDNPLYLSVLIQRLLMLDNEDFSEIARRGNDMKAIESYLSTVIQESPEDLDGICAALMAEAAERINQEQTDTLLALLATARKGLRETDLEGIFTQRCKTWNTLDFIRLKKYMAPFFMEREDGRIDFTHRSIREGIRKHLEQDEQQQKDREIQTWLKTLPDEDPVKLRELPYHAWRTDDKEVLIQYIDKIHQISEKEIIGILASEVHDICMEDDGEWFAQAIESGLDLVISHETVHFINFNFYDAFESDMKELAVNLSVQESNLRVAGEFSKIQNTNESRRDLSISYHKVAGIKAEQGKAEEALTLYEKSLA
ncbi:DUF4062 domain-containing protein, partial [Eubacterium sp.]|uniref:DUF4062 domain-containing protein n=1 Tax=Eubacterium sp. TaxID=142586 RepID=UPI002FC6C193